MGTYAIPDPRNPGGSILLYDNVSYMGIPVIAGFLPAPTASAPSGGAPLSASTGVSPQETSYSLYGHPIPLSVFGVGRIGGEIIAGPWVENGLASFIISFGVPADPSGTRDLREIAFDSQVVWTAAGGFTVEAFTYRFYGGTLTQAADTLETTHFGAEANAYRPQMLLAFSNLPLATQKFRKIPYVAAVIGDASGDDVNFGEMFERLAYSPWVGWTSAKFETTGITDGVSSGGLIIAQDAQFLQLIQQFGRFYPKWDILQTDKLRIQDRGNTVSSDITLDKSSLTGAVVMSRAEPNSVPKVLELSTIDPDADYTIVPSRAQTPIAPVAVSTSVKTESAYLPVIMDAATRASIVTYTKYHEEIIRKKISFTAMAYGLEIEPGDFVAITGLGNDFQDEVFRVIETLHGVNYVVEITAESILNCNLGQDDIHINFVVLLMGYEGANGSTGSPGMLDESPYLHGVAGVDATAAISTAQAKYGSGSLFLDGTADITYPWKSEYNIESNYFTIEMFIRPTSVTGIQFLISRWLTFLNLSWVFYLSGTTLTFNVSTTGADNIEVMSGGPVVINTWQHVAVDFDGTKYRLFLNGVMVGSSTTLRSIHNAGLAIELQIGGVAPSSFFYHGYIDELRFTVGISRYGSDTSFTVPTVAFPRPA